MKKIVKFKRKFLHLTIPLIIAAISFVSCSQKQGESCFVNNDCDGEDYICCMDSPEATKGICSLKSECVNDMENNDATDFDDSTDN